MFNIGTYRIINLITLKVYYGSAINIQKRFREHRLGKRSNVHLQRAISKYGLDSFSFEVVSPCQKEQLIEHEQVLLDLVRVYKNGCLGEINKDLSYNLAPTAGSALGVRRSEETKRKMSLAKQGQPSHNKGKHLSLETKAKIGKASKGRKHTEEAKQKNRLAHLGKQHTEEWKSKMSQLFSGEGNPMYGKVGELAPNFGKHLSEETKRKISQTEIQSKRREK
jgi:group I intron endonuclease